MIYIGADHAGYQTKTKIKKFLDKNKIHYIDVGTNKPKKTDDYPDYAKAVAKQTVKRSTNRGILTLLAAITIPVPVPQIKIPLLVDLLSVAKQTVK